jgi:NAD(P)-dependent dehydrogenase (short-subunit alcohol dehydrogenase family)
MQTDKRDNALVVGASGGIGYQINRRLTGCDRTVWTAARSERETQPDFLIDYAKPVDAEQLAGALEDRIDSLDIVVFATGFLHDKDFQPEKSIAQLAPEHMHHAYQVNAVGPLCLLSALTPLLKKARTPKVVFLSAQIGSIEDNRTGGWFSYRMAKAALNQGVRTAAIEAARWHNDATIVAVHPGTTLTNLSEPFVQRRTNLLSPAEAADRIVNLTLSLQPSMNGQFLTADGNQLPW